MATTRCLLKLTEQCRKQATIYSQPGQLSSKSLEFHAMVVFGYPRSFQRVD